MKTGKLKEVAALDQVLGICNAHGASYNPSKASLQPTALRSLLELAQENQKAVNVALQAYALAVNAREESFEGLSKLGTKVYRMVIASGARPSEIEEVRLIKRRFNHNRQSKTGANISTAQPGNTSDEKSTRRISRHDYLTRIDTFAYLIEMVSRIACYTPYEPELSVQGLKQKLEELKASCKAVHLASTDLNMSRLNRDKILYSTDGVRHTTTQVKAYLAGRFGFTSKEARQPSTIRF